MPRSYDAADDGADDVAEGVSPSWRYGGAHHRGGLPDQGDLYNPDGSLKKTWPNGWPPDDEEPTATNPKRPRKKKPGKPGRGQQMSRRARKVKPVRVRPRAGGGNAGTTTQAYPTASQATGGAQPLRDLDALGEVGLTPLLAELVNHGSVSLSTTLSAWQREQDRITNRTWRRPGGLYRPAGL